MNNILIIIAILIVVLLPKGKGNSGCKVKPITNTPRPKVVPAPQKINK